MSFLPRLAFACAAVLLSGALGRASLTQSAPVAPGSLAGQFLIASPSMGDPRFARTVIFMVKHDRSGALGIVINRPLGERPVAELLRALGDNPEGEGRLPIFLGGPVEPGVGFVLHSAEYRRAETVDVDGRVALTSSRGALRDIATGKGPKKTIVAFGYSGWAAGQLEAELKTDAWVVSPADLDLIFDEDRDKLWGSAMARRPRDI